MVTLVADVSPSAEMQSPLLLVRELQVSDDRGFLLRTQDSRARKHFRHENISSVAHKAGSARSAFDPETTERTTDYRWNPDPL